MLAALGLTGVAGAVAMLAFDVARAGNPSEHAGAASGLANTGGFTAAVATQLAAAAVLHVADVAIGVALLPMLAMLLVAAARVWRGTAPAARRAEPALSGGRAAA